MAGLGINKYKPIDAEYLIFMSSLQRGEVRRDESEAGDRPASKRSSYGDARTILAEVHAFKNSCYGRTWRKPILSGKHKKCSYFGQREIKMDKH